MGNAPVITRPTFDQASTHWESLLRQRGFETDCLWLFEENLCFENGRGKDDLKLRYQTRFTPPPKDAERLAYRYFCEFELPIVFYRIGSSAGKSLCVMLCDEWFSTKGADQGFVSKPDWMMLFHPGPAHEVEEITEAERWKTRVVKKRPMHDVDFSMTLRAVHETLAHGRVLSTYEHYALKFLHTWGEFVPAKNELDNTKRPN